MHEFKNIINLNNADGKNTSAFLHIERDTSHFFKVINL